MKKVIDKIAELKIVPVVTLERTEDAVPLASALMEGGIPAAEITFRTPCAAQAIRAISDSLPDMLVGAGTVLNAKQADEAIAAGADFIVSPGFDPDTVRHCMEKGVPVLPGCVTASEVQQAVDTGLTVLKFFPAEQSGGLKSIRALAAPFGQIRWMPTGGINLKNIKSYLGFSKILACGGSFMVEKRDIEEKNWDKIKEVCRQTIRLIHDEQEPAYPSAPLFQKADKKYDVITMGEILVRLAALPTARICDSGAFTAYVGGAELNVASGTARMGLRTGMISCLPDHDVGKKAVREVRRMGVDDRLISYDSGKDARLGLYYYETGAAPRKQKVVYDRSGSSFYQLDLDRLPQSVYADTRLFHISGITLALSQMRETAIEAIKRFKAGGALISFDVNYRANLWDEQTAFQVLNKILPLVDILFISEETSRRMFGKTGTSEEIMRSFCSEYGIRIVAATARKVVSGEEHGWDSTVYSASSDRFFNGEPFSCVSVVDRIGSGDAFVAGALYGLLDKGSEQDMVRYGNAMAVLKCTIPGDLPDMDKDEVENVISGHENHDRSEMSR